ncbi:MAG: HK97-gp10 family putative phage morphogenesis protein [Hyphomonadaceae bacterium]
MVEVRGLPELKKALKDLPGTSQRRGIRAGLNAASRLVRDKARVAAPVRTGVLKRNIQAKLGRIRGNSISAYVGVEAGKVPEADGSGRVQFKTRRGVKSRKLSARERRGEDPFYYKFQELGFTAVGRRKGGTGKKIPGKHFLRSAIENNSSDIVEAFTKSARERIERGR